MRTLKLPLVIVLLATLTLTASAANIPLPAWTFTGGGLGTWSGSSAGSNQVGLSALRNSSGSGSVSAYATSTNDILIVTTNTIYLLTTVGKVSGPGSGSMGLLVNGVGVTGIPILSTGNNVSPSLYTTSFTTSGAGDSRVGLPLRAQFSADAYLAGGGAFCTYTNITLTTSVVIPQLFLQRTNTTQFRLSWSTNFSWYALESSPDNQSSWISVTNAVGTEGTNRVVVVNADSAKQFFRLRQP